MAAGQVQTAALSQFVHGVEVRVQGDGGAADRLRERRPRRLRGPPGQIVRQVRRGPDRPAVGAPIEHGQGAGEGRRQGAEVQFPAQAAGRLRWERRSGADVRGRDRQRGRGRLYRACRTRQGVFEE